METKQKNWNLCIVNGNELCPSFGGVDRVSSTLADFFESQGITVYHLATQRCFPEKELGENQFIIPAGTAELKQKFCEEFFRSHGIRIAMIQGATNCPPLPRGVKTISVLHANPGLWTDSSITGHINSSTRLSRFPFSLLKPILKFPLIRKAILRKFQKSERGQYCHLLTRDRTVLLSPNFIPDFLKCAGIEKCPDSLTAIPNPAPFPSSQHCEGKENKILFVGRLQNAQKRVDLLLKIWAILEPVFPDWSLDIVGDGIDRGMLEKLARSLSLRRAYFLGHQNPVGFYKKSKIFTLTSECEGFGMVLVEAAAYGCVPVAFNSYAAAGDIIDDGNNGFLIAPFDVQKYADTLACVIKNDEEWQRLSMKAPGITEKFSIENVGGQWLSLFDELLR